MGGQSKVLLFAILDKLLSIHQEAEVATFHLDVFSHILVLSGQTSLEELHADNTQYILQVHGYVWIA